MASLLVQMGGRAAVAGAVTLFYDKVLADADLAPFFENSNMDHQRKRQVIFLSSMLAGTSKYTKIYMSSVHRPLVETMDLNETHFAKIVAHLTATLSDVGVPNSVAEEVLGAVASLKDHILNRDMKTAA